MNNYRVTFLHDVECDYWDSKKHLQAESYLSFHELHEKYYPIVLKIRKAAKFAGIRFIWNFYEPYVEITWLSNEIQATDFLQDIKTILEEHQIKDLKAFSPIHGNFSEWFCNNEVEREFGAKRYGVCADLVSLFEAHRGAITSGKGVSEQVKRTIHAICNPLGLNYWEEAKICFSRGLICLLFRFFSFKKAVWIYTKILRQKY